MPGRLFLSRYSRQNILCLTDADGRQHPDAVIRGLALWEDELDAVLGEGEGHDGDGAGPHYEALRPQPHKPDEGAQRVQDVGVVSTRLTTIRYITDCQSQRQFSFAHCSPSG